MDNFKVSVVIPVYNAGLYLRQCLDSVCGQTLKDIEILCVNDESTDDSEEIIEEYVQRDSRVHLIQNHHIGGGAGSARNTGMSRACGKYLSVLDADDFFELDMLEKMYDRAETTGAEIVICDNDFYDSALEKFEPGIAFANAKKCFPTKEVFTMGECDNIAFKDLTVAWRALLRLELVRKNCLLFPLGANNNDFPFILTALAMAEKITTLDERLVHYRINRAGSQTSGRNAHPLAAVRAISDLRQNLYMRGKYEQFRMALVHVLLSECRSWLEILTDFEAIQILWTFLKIDGFTEFGVGLQMDKDNAEFTYDELELMDWIRNSSPEKWLLEQNRRFKNVYSDSCLRFSFPQKTFCLKDRVVLYGAGRVGKVFYEENEEKKYCTIVCWADKNAAGCDPRVIQPDGISRLTYDAVLIAIENPKTAEEIRYELQQMGIPASKIYWYDPHRKSFAFEHEK